MIRIRFFSHLRLVTIISPSSVTVTTIIIKCRAPQIHSPCSIITIPIPDRCLGLQFIHTIEDTIVYPTWTAWFSRLGNGRGILRNKSDIGIVRVANERDKPPASCGIVVYNGFIIIILEGSEIPECGCGGLTIFNVKVTVSGSSERFYLYVGELLRELRFYSSVYFPGSQKGLSGEHHLKVSRPDCSRSGKRQTTLHRRSLYSLQ